MTTTLGYWKLNFDTSFKDGYTTTRVVLKNANGNTLGAWTNNFESHNVLCAKIEAAIQTLKIAEVMRIDKILFEGDIANVILTLNGLDDFGDWRARSLIAQGRGIL